MARKSWRYLTLVLVASLLAVAAVALAGELALRQTGDGPMCRGERATIVGTAGVDRLVGTPGRDVIVAGPGGDVVVARGGNDVVCDREGADRVSGGRGNDRIGGGSGADRLTAGPGNDWLAGRRGADTMLGGRGNDRLFGERGNDALRGNAGDDLLAGGSDRDSCIGGAGTDVLRNCESGDQGSDLPAPSPGEGQPPGGPPPITNHAPTGVSLSAAVVAENEPIGTTVGSLSAGDPDPGDTHSFALVPGAGSDDNGSFQIVGSTLRTNAVFDYEAKSTYTVRIRATDFGKPAGQIVRAFTITVTDVDDAPTAVDDSATVGEDSGAGAIAVLANDTDTDGGPMSVASVMQPANGMVVITGGGTGLTYQPAPNYCSATPDTFTYTLNGGDSATVSVTVTCVDDAPTAVDDAATVPEDSAATPLDVLANDTDPDDPTTIASASDPANGTVVLTGGLPGAHTGLTYQPDPNYCNSPPGTTPDTFTYTLNGGSTATVSVTVTCGDDAPTAVADTATVGEDSAAGAIDVLANDTDSDGGPKTIASASDPANGTVVLTGGSAGAHTGLTYQPDANYCGPDTFTYTLNGGSTATVSVTVTCVDDAPTAIDDSASVVEDSPASAIAVLANDTDTDGGPMSVASVTQPTNGTVVITGAGSGLTYQPAPNYCSATPDTFTYTLNGGDSATVSVTVTCVDDPPTAVNDSKTVAEDAAATDVDVLANDTDVDGGPKSVASVTQSTNGMVVITGGGTGLTYQPNPGYCNDPPGTMPDVFTYTLNGGSTATVSVTVSCNDNPPTAVDDSATVAEDSGASAIDVLANDTDTDGGPRSVASVTQPANGTVVITGGGSGLTYQPNANFCNSQAGGAPDTFTYTLNGGDSATVSVTVTCVDDPPTAVGDSATVVEDSAAGAVAVLANDLNADGGPISIASASDPANGAVAVTGGGTGLTYQPDANFCGPDTFTYTLNGGSTATVSMTVTCAPDNPVVDTSAGSTSYTENAAATAIDATVTVSDPDAGTTITGATVKLTGGYAGAEDILALAGSHPDITATLSGDTLTLTGNASVAAYQAALRDVTYRNSSENPSTAPRTVTFTVTDDTARTGSDTKGLTVSAVDDPPTAVNDSATVLEDAAATAITVLTNDTDVDAGPRSVASVTQPANGTVAITGGGTGLTYQPNANYCNTPPGTTLSTFTYTLNGGSSATVSVTVTCVNDAPVADDETFDGANGAIGNTSLVVNDPDDGAPALGSPKKTISGDILAGDSDIDGPGPLTVTAGTFATNDGGQVTIEADGDFIYINDPADNCADTSDFFDYTVSDQNPSGPGPAPGTDTGRVTIAVAGCVWYVNNNDPAGNSGTSRAPFDTLAQAETASLANHTVFVFDGNNTSTGYDGNGYTMNAGERLIGEHEGLTVDPDQGGPLTGQTLHPANPGAHPTLTATAADVIDLDDANEVRGLTLDPSGAGGGIAGSTGDVSGTFDDVNITDTTTAGTQPGLELDATSGTFAVSNFTVNTNGATGVRLNNAGTVTFAPTGNISITSANAAGLIASGTGLGTSTFDAITVTGSGTGGVSMTNTTGTTTFGDLALTTTSGATAAFALSNAGTVSVPAAGTTNVSATGGPAVDVTGTAGANLAFDAVSSTNSANDGINLAGLGTGTLSAASGTISGAAGIAFDLDGGSGDVTYPGALNNGAGQTAEITGRSGGAVTLSGAIADTNDAGGGINLASNTGGTTTFSNASKVINSVAGTAVAMATSDGHTLTLSGGGLDVDTTTGAGINATTSGTLVVSGTGNTIDSVSATALNVTNTDIGAGGATFQRISSGNSTAAADPANGIVLNNTGASAGLTVTGNGGSCTSAATCTGGAIQSATATGVSLTNVPGGASLTRMFVGASGDDGIGGSNVTGLTLDNATVTGNGNTAQSGGVHGDHGIDFTDLTGTVTFTSSNVSNNIDSNVVVSNNSGNLNMAVTGGAYSGATGGMGDGIFVEGLGTGSQNLNIQGPITFSNNVGDHVQHSADADNTTDSDVTINNTTMTSPAAANGGPFCAINILGGGIVASHGGAAVGGSNLDLTITNNNIQNSCIGAIAVGTTGSVGDPQLARVDATIQNNVIGTTGVAGSGSVQGNGIFVDSNGNGLVRTLITGNTVRQWTNRNGLHLDVLDGDAEMSATVRNNVFTEPNSAFAGTSTRGMTIQLGAQQTGDSIDACLDIGHPTDAGLKNQVAGTGEAPQPDIRYLHEGPGSVVQLAGYGGPAAPSIADIAGYLQPRNNRVATPTVTGIATASGGSTTSTVASCPLPAG